MPPNAKILAGRYPVKGGLCPSSAVLWIDRISWHQEGWQTISNIPSRIKQNTPNPAFLPRCPLGWPGTYQEEEQDVAQSKFRGRILYLCPQGHQQKRIPVVTGTILGLAWNGNSWIPTWTRRSSSQSDRGDHGSLRGGLIQPGDSEFSAREVFSPYSLLTRRL